MVLRGEGWIVDTQHSSPTQIRTSKNPILTIGTVGPTLCIPRSKRSLISERVPHQLDMSITKCYMIRIVRMASENGFYISYVRICRVKIGYCILRTASSSPLAHGAWNAT